MSVIRNDIICSCISNAVWSIDVVKLPAEVTEFDGEKTVATLQPFVGKNQT